MEQKEPRPHPDCHADAAVTYIPLAADKGFALPRLFEHFTLADKSWWSPASSLVWMCFYITALVSKASLPEICICAKKKKFRLQQNSGKRLTAAIVAQNF